MSEIQTVNWINKTEGEVVAQIGNYKKKEKVDSGYKILYDFSTYRIPTYQKKTTDNYRPIRDNQGRQIGVMPEGISSTPSALNRNQNIETILERKMEFYFDANNKVKFVLAVGYPDSVRYEPRKK